MDNESFGILLIIIISLLYLIGISSLVISCFLDKKYQIPIISNRKHYFNKQTDELESVIINPNSCDLDIEID